MGRVDEIVTQIAGQIASGQFLAGQKLPSVRIGAAQYGVSKNTMAEAYDRLVARGMLLSRQGSGYYVTGHLPAAPPPPRPDVTEASGIVSLLREQLEQHYETRPGDGRPPASWTEGSELRRFMARGRSAAADVQYGYGSSWGLAALRGWLRLSMAERSIPVEADGVMLTSGINHGFDLIIRHMLEPGDTVFVDSPGYYPLFAKLRLAKVTMVPIRRLMDGPDLEDLAAKLAIWRPKMFFTQSQGHNPTGGGLSPAVAFGLMKLADAHDFRIVEDDAFADLHPTSLPRLAALGQQRRVLYVGSFSKTLSASLRCGYVAGTPEIIRGLVDLKMITTVATSAHVERLVIDLIDSGQYLKHLRRLRVRMEEGTKTTIRAFAELGIELAAPKVPGFYLWAPLPEGTDERAFCRAAAEANIFVAPAAEFRPDRDHSTAPGMRVNVAYGADPRFQAFLRQQLQR